MLVVHFAAPGFPSGGVLVTGTGWSGLERKKKRSYPQASASGTVGDRGGRSFPVFTSISPGVPDFSLHSQCCPPPSGGEGQGGGNNEEDILSPSPRPFPWQGEGGGKAPAASRCPHTWASRGRIGGRDDSESRCVPPVRSPARNGAAPCRGPVRTKRSAPTFVGAGPRACP